MYKHKKKIPTLISLTLANIQEYDLSKVKLNIQPLLIHNSNTHLLS